MSLFTTFRNFVSPSKKPNRPSDSLKELPEPNHPPNSLKKLPEPRQRPNHGSKTSITTTKDGLNTPPQTPKGSVKKVKLSDGLGVQGSRVKKSVPSPKPGKTPSSSAKSLSKFLNLLPSIIYKQEKSSEEQIVRSPENLEGSTFVDDATPERSPSLEGETTLIGEDEKSYEDEKMSDDDVSPIDSHANRLVAENIENGQVYKGWSEDEIWLYEKLDNRGYEPLLPKSWDLDFPTLFDDLFSEDDSEAFINTLSGRKYHACKELDALIMLGARVRDRLKANLSPEETLRRQIESYYDWSLADADLKTMDYIPTIAVATADPDETVVSVVGRITDQLHEIGDRYRARWIDQESSDEIEQFYVHDLPTLYGIVIIHTLVSVVTHDTIYPEGSVKCLGVFDFQKAGQDVWHALAIGIIFMRARNDILVLKAEGEYEEGSKVESSMDDPDA